MPWSYLTLTPCRSDMGVCTTVNMKASVWRVCVCVCEPCVCVCLNWSALVVGVSLGRKVVPAVSLVKMQPGRWLTLLRVHTGIVSLTRLPCFLYRLDGSGGRHGGGVVWQRIIADGLTCSGTEVNSLVSHNIEAWPRNYALPAWSLRKF